MNKHYLELQIYLQELKEHPEIIMDQNYQVFKSEERLYVTGYWKTDHNVTLGQLHFIGPANSHTHALSMH